jgi:hypothetical protein
VRSAHVRLRHVPAPLTGPDLADCHELLSAIPSQITPLNDGLTDLQFQSVSFNPKNPEGELLGGTQDNGTWSFTGTPAWFESVGGDGGQSGFNSGDPTIRFHNYYDATPDVNYNGNDPHSWLAIYDPLQASGENRGFYTPFISDPRTPGRLFTGLESVWRTDDNGGAEADLATDCNETHLNYSRTHDCGDWVQIGPKLTSNAFGTSRAGQYVVETERSVGDTGTLWAATRIGRVFVSSNADDAAGDVRFTRIDDDATTPGRFPSAISVDPADPNHAFISYSGYEAYTPGEPGHVFEVTYDPQTRKATWTDRSYNITTTANPTGADQPVTGVAFDAYTGDVYASTDFGVLRLPKGSTSWEQAAGGMPTVAVSGLSISQDGRLLYAATHGRSVYALRLAPGTAPTGNPTPTPTPTASGTPAGSAAPTPTPTATPAKKDHQRPRLTLHRIHRVNDPRRSTLHGIASDKSGLKNGRVRIRWGDKKVTFATVGANGRFTAHHRYKQPKAYQVRVTATDGAGNTRVKKALARVLRRHQKVNVK